MRLAQSSSRLIEHLLFGLPLFPEVLLRSSLQVGHRRQVGRELDDAGGAAPVGAGSARIDRRACDACGIERAGERAAIALRQIRVGVTNVEGEDLVSEADADVPGIIAGVRNAIGETRNAIESIRRAEPLATDLG